MTNHVHLIAIPADAKSLSLALGQSHSQYSLEINRARRRTGHLWQNRFSSCPLDSSHLQTAMRYVELNPLRAGMVVAACDWPWSSARVHTVRDANDPLLDWPWQNWMQQARLGIWNCEDWNASLRSPLPERELEMIRRAARLGEPLGSPAFLAGLERQTGRRLRILAPGRPAKQGIATGEPNRQYGWFGASKAL
jgi:putative transposase